MEAITILEIPDSIQQEMDEEDDDDGKEPKQTPCALRTSLMS